MIIKENNLYSFLVYDVNNNNTFKKIERINKSDENSNYKVLDTLYNVSPLLYKNPIFNEEGSKPIIINEDLLKIEE